MTQKSEKQALVLFGHGARDPAWARPLCRVCENLQQQMPERQIACAYLEYLTPTLDDCVAGLIVSGAKAIVVLPMFIAQGGHLKRELPELIAKLEVRYPETRFQLASAVGESDRVIAAMVAHAAELLGP